MPDGINYRTWGLTLIVLLFIFIAITNMISHGDRQTILNINSAPFTNAELHHLKLKGYQPEDINELDLHNELLQMALNNAAPCPEGKKYGAKQAMKKGTINLGLYIKDTEALNSNLGVVLCNVDHHMLQTRKFLSEMSRMAIREELNRNVNEPGLWTTNVTVWKAEAEEWKHERDSPGRQALFDVLAKNDSQDIMGRINEHGLHVTI